MAKPSEAVCFLLVDDLEENLLALEALLRREGRVILKARSGPAALELLLQHDVALALVDVQMPGMDGYELAELMRGTERTRCVPIIFVTAGTTDRQRRFRGYEAGAVDFIQKPIEPDVIKSKADVFAELYQQRLEVTRQRDELRIATDENARLLAESRRQADALREADRRKDEFLAMLAHELRNPLSPIRNAVEVMRTQETSSTNVTWARDVIDRQIRQLTRLVDDLLDVSRISRGKIELRKEPTDLASIIDNAVESAQPLIDARRHKVSIDLPSRPIHLDADPARLSQVFMNLLNNAAKYMQNEGSVRLTAERAGDEAIIRVRDTGFGIPAEMLPRVFEMFTQLDSTLERSEGGLGIGLSLVKRLVEQHGGSVEACSEGIGKGSEFTVRLPALSESATPEGPGAQAAPAVTRRRILIVDDNRDAAESLALLLKLTGNEIATAFDGLAAIDAARDFHPDLILLDLGLPKIDGYEVARRVREQRPDVVLIAVTGWGQEDDRRRSREAGFDHHLTKPVMLSDLQEILKSHGPSTVGT